MWMWFAGKKGLNTKNLSNEKTVPLSFVLFFKRYIN